MSNLASCQQFRWDEGTEELTELLTPDVSKPWEGHHSESWLLWEDRATYEAKVREHVGDGAVVITLIYTENMPCQVWNWTAGDNSCVNKIIAFANFRQMPQSAVVVAYRQPWPRIKLNGDPALPGDAEYAGFLQANRDWLQNMEDRRRIPQNLTFMEFSEGLLQNLHLQRHYWRA